jgi:hypothetical protein
MVQKGKFAACAPADVIALKMVDLPTLGRPTIPHLKPMIAPEKFWAIIAPFGDDIKSIAMGAL